MAEQLLLCAENLFADTQFPDHVGSANEEATGMEWWHVANGRRYLADRWQSTTANAEAYVQCLFDVPRSYNFCAIDRASNHKGYGYDLASSADSFTSEHQNFTLTIPSVIGGLPAGALGCVTTEGAWLKTFTEDLNTGIRLTSQAMGAGLVPQLVGVWVGLAWTPSASVTRHPMMDETFRVTFSEATSPFGWSGRGQRARVRQGSCTIAFADLDAVSADEILLRYHLDLYAAGHPMWLCWRKTDAPWKAMLVACPNDAVIDWRYDVDWAFRRQVTIPFMEESPA